MWVSDIKSYWICQILAELIKNCAFKLNKGDFSSNILFEENYVPRFLKKKNTFSSSYLSGVKCICCMFGLQQY